MAEAGDDERVRRLLAVAVGSLPTGAARPGQQRMAAAVAQTLREGGALLVQAGTGTGKSLGYLVPVLAQRRRVVVATATKALQSQLVDEDLPRLVDALTPLLGRRPTFALAKGRHNYACLLRAHGEAEPDDGQEMLLPGAAVETADGSVLGRQVLRLRQWALQTDSGDRDDVEFTVDDRAWAQVSISARDCVGPRCPYRADCHSERARETAREADVVVANHTLLTLDLAGGGRSTSDVEAIVVDEAHELADRATEALTEEITATLLRRSVSAAAKQVATGTRDRLQQAADDATAELAVLGSGHLPQLPPTLATALRQLAAQAGAADAELAAAARAEEEPDPQTAGERDRARVLLQQVSGAAGRLVRCASADAAYVAGGALRVAPLHVGGDLARTLFPDRAVVLTSATLAIGGSMDTTASALGLQPGAFEGLDVGSPFSYSTQGMLYVAAQLPDPGRDGARWAAAVDDHLVELIAAAGGRTLALFSSMAAARRAAAACRDRLDVPVLLQGEDTAPVLRHRFAADVRACLFGVRTFWQGVDVAGSSCQLVVVDRIPFPHVNDPLVAARTAEATAAGRNGFGEVSVPAAAVLLAQGVGRLVRSTDDRGVVAVLDPRLATARYAGVLRRTLPPLWWTTDQQVVLGALARLDAGAPPPRPAGPAPAERRRTARAASSRSSA